ncbi:Hypothetical protein PHPALM_331 [Phytophthora palmivora]|uniref:Uncharacterized protein n=1 Tax=Phytophthora palmivora TaxID=4796 RepID=A0A2P4YV37_9STRA|nr:Hypothetical protein PHPALM_331 [Phytophthora palmivora]
MAFCSRWAELKKLRWTSKRPFGRLNGFTYFQPGKTKKDVRGQDYYVGEQELMKYLNRCDLDIEQDPPQRNLGPILDAVASDDDDDDAKNAPPSPNPSEVTYVSNEMIFGGELDTDEAIGQFIIIESISKTVLDDMAATGWTDSTTCTLYPYMSGPYGSPDPKVAFEDYSRLYDGPFGPTEDALAAAATPSGAYF